MKITIQQLTLDEIKYVFVCLRFKYKARGRRKIKGSKEQNKTTKKTNEI